MKKFSRLVATSFFRMGVVKLLDESVLNGYESKGMV